MAAQTKTVTKLKKVDGLIKEGSSVQEACEKAGIHYSTYYNHKKKKPKRKYTKRTPKAKQVPEYSQVVLDDPKPAMLVVGSPEQIADVLRSYHG